MVILYLYFFIMGCTKGGRWEREGGGGGREGGRKGGRKRERAGTGVNRDGHCDNPGSNKCTLIMKRYSFPNNLQW